MLRNSGFWFAQRQNPGNATTYSTSTGRAICADGWGLTCENTSSTYRRTDALIAPEANLQSRYYGRFLKTLITGKLEITQGIEESDSANVRGRTVRVQVQLRGLVTASALWNVGLVQYTGPFTNLILNNFYSAQNANGTDPTLGANYAYITPNGAFPADGGVIVGNKIQAMITSDPTWVRVGGCFDVPTTGKNLIVVIWSDSQVAVNAGIAVTEAHLVNSTAIQDWLPLPQEEELARVQRYYSKSFNTDTLPASSVVPGRVYGWVSAAGVTAGQRFGIRLPVTLVPRQNNPTVTLFNPGGAGAQARNIVTGDDATVTNFADQSENGFEVHFTGQAAWVVGQPVVIQYTIDAEV